MAMMVVKTWKHFTWLPHPIRIIFLLLIKGQLKFHITRKIYMNFVCLLVFVQIWVYAFSWIQRKAYICKYLLWTFILWYYYQQMANDHIDLFICFLREWINFNSFFFFLSMDNDDSAHLISSTNTNIRKFSALLELQIVSKSLNRYFW